MAKLQLKGTIGAVSPSYEVGTEKKIKKQTFLLMVPGWRDSFGEQKGQDEWWSIDIVGEDNITKFGLKQNDDLQQKATVDLYINSSWVKPKKEGDKDLYIINVVAATITPYTK